MKLHMLNDIYATSMRGEYVTRDGDGTIEKGTWTFIGYGNAEIKLQAHGELVGENACYVVTIHSSERQLNYVHSSLLPDGGGSDRASDLEAEIAGYELTLKAGEGGLGRTLNVPDETIYDGTSPIWLIHLMMTATPPDDREIVAPVIFFDVRRGMLEGGFYRFSRRELSVHVTVLNQNGEVGETFDVELSDDASPRRISRGGLVTEIVRLPAS